MVEGTIETRQQETHDTQIHIGTQEEEVDFMDEDEAVLVPWGRQSLLLDSEAATQGTLMDDEEGLYSEDEEAEASGSTNTKIDPDDGSQAIADDGGLPPFRPFFDTRGVDDATSFHIDSGIVVPASINRHLRPYQREGVEFLYGKYKSGIGGVLGDDMG